MSALIALCPFEDKVNVAHHAMALMNTRIPSLHPLPCATATRTTSPPDVPSSTPYATVINKQDFWNSTFNLPSCDAGDETHRSSRDCPVSRNIVT